MFNLFMFKAIVDMIGHSSTTFRFIFNLFHLIFISVFLSSCLSLLLGLELQSNMSTGFLVIPCIFFL